MNMRRLHTDHPNSLGNPKRYLPFHRIKPAFTLSRPKSNSLEESFMSGSADSIDSMDTTLQMALSECAECEARLRHVLAYICEKRHRRWTASAAVFLLIYYVSSIPFDSLYSLASDVLELGGIGYNGVFSPGMLALVILTTTFLPPLVITLLIFSRLRKIYRGF